MNWNFNSDLRQTAACAGAAAVVPPFDSGQQNKTCRGRKDYSAKGFNISEVEFLIVFW